MTIIICSIKTSRTAESCTRLRTAEPAITGELQLRLRSLTRRTYISQSSFTGIMGRGTSNVGRGRGFVAGVRRGRGQGVVRVDQSRVKVSWQGLEEVMVDVLIEIVVSKVVVKVLIKEVF
ncbi:hypothetical protein HanXRQr2_Chr06g0269241 [Helianthus annuus]|uniref:Uncharacterized protein n=1 Tax=Helianthus annuus TaxID=4232 RepID=A0A251T6N9_HELAN|nr:hypothetical protein HanXRQr2_Chr06g0269241 [Helianthus annuus]KAJ0916283.1 hypothetical protein HanPSC8_Chr06g0259881 [Helianthus annuus]